MSFSIRHAVVGDGHDLQRIELLAGQRFLEVDMREIAADEPFSVEELAVYARAGRSFVAVDEDDRAVGFVLTRRVDHSAHVVQVSVAPELQGRGIGRALLEQVEFWARENRFSSVTLLTFSNVPWNRPLYEHLGFRVLEEFEIGPELAAVRDHETSIGLDPSLRVAMRKEVDSQVQNGSADRPG